MGFSEQEHILKFIAGTIHLKLNPKEKINKIYSILKKNLINLVCVQVLTSVDC